MLAYLFALVAAAGSVWIHDLKPGVYNDGRGEEVEINYEVTLDASGFGTTPNVTGRFSEHRGDLVNVSAGPANEPSIDHYIGSLYVPGGTTIIWVWGPASLVPNRPVFETGSLVTQSGGYVTIPYPARWDTLRVTEGSVFVGVSLSFDIQYFPTDGDLTGLIFYGGSRVGEYGTQQIIFRKFDRDETTATDPYRVNPSFSLGDLTADQRFWYDRFRAAAVAAWADGSAAYRERAASGNSYELARWANLSASADLCALRATHDPAFLDSSFVLMRDMRADLQYFQIGTPVPHLGWPWLEADPTYHGTDMHHMDEALLHAWLAEATYALLVNGDLNPEWKEMGEFFRDYLKNEFEAKWIERTGDRYLAWETPEGFYKNLWHPYSALARLAHFFSKIYDDSDHFYVSHRDLVVNKLFTDARYSSEDGIYWPHRVGSYSSEGVQKLNYARYTWLNLTPLILDGVIDQYRGEQFATTFLCCLSTPGVGRVDCSVDDGGTGPESFISAAYFGHREALLEIARSAYEPTSVGMYVAGFSLFGATVDVQSKDER